MADDWDAIVIGGGLAGMAAATQLSDSGLRVLLLDKRPYLGGRASSFRDHVTGQLTDVCQHVTLGCCTAFEDFLGQMGASDRLKYLDRITFQDPSGRRADLFAAPLPPPFHLAPSLLRLPWLSMADRWSAVELLRALSEPEAPDDDGLDFLQFLQARGVSPGLVRLVVEPVIVSACNAASDSVAAEYGRTVLRETLVRSRTGYRLGLFTVPLGELFTEPVSATMARSGGMARLRTTVRNVTHTPPSGFCVYLQSGESLRSRACILAVPFDVAPTLLAADMLDFVPLASASALRHAPIVATHLWFDEVLDCPEAIGLLDRDVHWVFNKSRTWTEAPAYGTYLTTVTSDAHQLADMDHREVLTRVLEDVAGAIGVASLPPPRHCRVTVERKATFVPGPGVDRLRAPQMTGIVGLALAGEWTATGWPSTMESAVRSGRAAARCVLQYLR